jgi:hypothetical protein
MSPLAIELASGSVWETGSAEMLGLKLLFSREKVFVTGMYTPIQKRPSAFCLLPSAFCLLPSYFLDILSPIANCLTLIL